MSLSRDSRIRLGIALGVVCITLLLGAIGIWHAQRQQIESTPIPATPASQATVVPTSTPLPTATPSPLTPPTPTPSSPQPTPSPTPDSPPVRLIIPALNLDVPVVEIGWRIVGKGTERHSEWQMPDYAAGHHINSANPGQAGNVVISGHHNVKGKVFEPISQDVDREEPRLKPGSEIQLYAADGRSYTYQVEQVLLLQEVGATEEERRQNARWMAPTQEPILTLITRWPLWANTHHVVVVARLKR